MAKEIQSSNDCKDLRLYPGETPADSKKELASAGNPETGGRLDQGGRLAMRTAYLDGVGEFLGTRPFHHEEYLLTLRDCLVTVLAVLELFVALRTGFFEIHDSLLFGFKQEYKPKV